MQGQRPSQLQKGIEVKTAVNAQKNR